MEGRNYWHRKENVNSESGILVVPLGWGSAALALQEKKRGNWKNST